MGFRGLSTDSCDSERSTPRASGDLLVDPALRQPAHALELGDRDEQIKVQWKALFAFTTKLHILPLAIALVLAVISGIIIPALALFLGRLFDSFTDFGTGKINGNSLTDQISTGALYLVALGSCSWLLNGSFFTFWLLFGELQAKGARSRLFSGMLHKQISWFDSHKAGVGSLLPRIQT